MHAVESPPEPLMLFITGSAGTGKSHVISVVHEHFERAQIGDGCACMLMAPTGVAAFNIGGLTIHKALNLPVEHGKRTPYRKLASERLHGMRRLWKSVTTIIIDEISMVSYQTLNFVHQRLTEIKGTDDTEVLFGGSMSLLLETSFNYHLLETNLYSRKVMVIILVLPTCGEISSQWWS